MNATRPLRAAAEVLLGRQRSPEHETGDHVVPYLRAANINDGWLALEDINSMNFTPAEQDRFRLRPGDVLVTEGSGSLHQVGQSAVWNGELAGVVCFQNTLLRLRPRQGTDGRFLAWWACHAFASGMFAASASGANIFHLSAERLRSLPIELPPPAHQRAIANFLEAETRRIDDLVAMKRRLLVLIDERIDSRILDLIGRSPLTGGVDVPATSIRRVLTKLERWTTGGDVVTAFRDGEVTTRAERAAIGFTNAWAEDARVQAVAVGDVVIHGLDGFSGAIGDARRAGVCSPVYHVCDPGDGDSAFYGRMLRLLALGGYLGNFATSTRERAVDFRNWDMFGRIPVPHVPVAEQRSIGDAIRRARPLREKVLLSEARAREHRQALITAAVTGQLDVTKAVA